MHCRTAILTLILCLASSASALAEVRWSPVTGELELRYMGYEEDSDLEDRNHFGEAELRLQINGQLTDALQLTAIPVVQVDTGIKTEGQFRLVDDQLRRPAATFEELKLTYYGSKWEIGVGKQIFSWGVSEGLRPTDNLNPADFLDVPTAHKLGVPSFSLLRYGKVDVQLVVLPIFTPHRLPEPDNRWAIVPEESLRELGEALGFDPILVVSRELPVNTLDNAQAGLRLRSSRLARGWDLELSLFHGFDPFGLFDISLAIPEVRVDLFYPEYTEVGGGFSTAQGGFVVHGEIAYHRTSGDDEDDYFQYAAGFSYTMNDGIPRALDSILLGFEYAGESVDNDRIRPPTVLNTGFNRVFTNSPALRVDFTFSERTSLGFGGGINLDDDDFVARVQLSHKFTDAYQLVTGIDSFAGDAESFYGNWEENDRLFVFGTYFF